MLLPIARFRLRSDALPPVNERSKHEQEPQNRKREGQAPRFHTATGGKVDSRHDGEKHNRDQQPMKPEHCITMALSSVAAKTLKSAES